METGTFFLIKYLGIMFLITSLMRICFYNNRQKELNSMNLPSNFDMLIILFEFAMGMILIFDLIDKKKSLILLLFFLVLGTILIIMNNYNKILSETFDIFFYNPSMECVTLHFTYMVLILGIVLNL